MRRFSFLFIVLLTVLTGSAKIMVKNVPATPIDTLQHLIMSPDFAFPVDVSENTIRYVEENPVDKYPGNGALRLRAFEAWATAQLSIDNLAIDSIISNILNYAKKEPVPSTRAMFLTYAGALAQERRSNIFSADSLFAEALNLPGTDTALTEYSAALSEYDATVSPVKTVEEFTLMKMSRNFNILDELAEARLSSYSLNRPLGLFYKIISFKSDREASEFLLKQAKLGQDVTYGLEAFLVKRIENISLKDQYDFLSEIKNAKMAYWMTSLVDELIDICRKPRWEIKSTSDIFADVPFKIEFSSSNTDSLAIKIEKYTVSRVDKINRKDKKVLKTLVFRPHSSVETEYDTLNVTLPAGYYMVSVVGYDDSYTSDFTVYPWAVETLQTDKSTYLIQVMDAITGKGMKNLEVSVAEYGSNDNKLKATTDPNGIAVFKKPIGSQIIVADKAKNLSFEFRSWFSYWVNSSEEENLKRKRVSIFTDLPMYHRGDTVKWEMIATGIDAPVSNNAERLKVYLPQGKDSKVFLNFVTPLTDAFGRACGSFVIPGDADLGFASISGPNCFCSFQIEEFKLPEISLKDNAYTLAGDSVIISGVVVNRTGAPRAATMVKILADQTVDSLYTNSEGKFSFRLLRKRDPKYTWQNNHYAVEAITPDGYNARYDGYYPSTFDVSVAAEYDYINNATKGLTFKITAEYLGKKTDGEPFECRWSIRKTGAETPVLEGTALPGTVVLQPKELNDLEPGIYILTVQPLKLVGDKSNYTILIYNSSLKKLPVSDVIWTPSDAVSPSKSGTVDITIGCREDKTTLWWAAGGLKNSVGKVDLNKGFQYLKLDGFDGDRLFFWAVKNGETSTISVDVDKENQKQDSLTVRLESFRDYVVAGSAEKWSILTLLNDKPAECAVSVNVYDQRLQNKMNLFSIIKAYKFNTDFNPYVNTASRVNSYIRRLKFSNINLVADCIDNLRSKLYPEFFALPRSLYSARLNRSAALYGFSAMKMTEIETVTEAAVADESVANEKAETGNAVEPNNIAVREGYVYNALWSPMLTTDSLTGRVTVDFLIPNQTTVWNMDITAWTRKLVSKKVVKTFTATKPIYVTPNLPRFVRVGDRVNIVTAINNTTDSVLQISFDVTAGDDVVKGKCEVVGKGVHFVTYPLKVEGQLALADTLSFTFRAYTADYSDGENVKIPILPSSALVVESEPFYLTAKNENFILDVPSNSNGVSETELHYTANPVWTVVESLRSVIENIDEILPIAGAAARAWYSANTAIKIAEQHPVVKSAFNIDAAKKIRNDAANILLELQNSDGGFRFSSWQTNSSLWNTMQILQWLGNAQADSKLGQSVKKALEYVDSHIVPSKSKPGTNIPYALMRLQYGEPSTLEARQVVDNSINDVVKNWKKFDLANKCRAALLLARYKYASTAKEILRSICQHSVTSPQTGMSFPNISGLIPYVDILESFLLVDPENTNVDAIRQALLCQRRGYSWGSVARTTTVVKAFLTTGDNWLVPQGATKIYIDNVEVTVPAQFNETGSISLPVSGEKVRIEKASGTPSYGAVVTKRVVELAEVPAFKTAQLSIEKSIYLTDVNGVKTPVDKATLKPGEKVTVSLKIFSDKEMTNLVIDDGHSAALEPLTEGSTYRYAMPGLWYYMINDRSNSTFYIDYLPRGYTTIEYQAVINNSGTFTTGIATLTSEEDIDLTVHSASAPFYIGPKD